LEGHWEKGVNPFLKRTLKLGFGGLRYSRRFGEKDFFEGLRSEESGYFK